MTTNDGGQAFPRPSTDVAHGSTGMSVREWFAGLAMQGILGGMPNRKDGYAPDIDLACLSSDVYQIADAMLAESRREREPDGGEGERDG